MVIESLINTIMKKFILTILFSFIFNLAHTQCYELLANKLDSIDIIPYTLVDKFVYGFQSGKTISVKLSNVRYKQKLGFIFQSKDLGDTIDVYLMTLNRKLLASKTITNQDYFLRYDPFKKSENYFLIISTKQRLDSSKRPIKGCLGLVILERVKSKTFSKVQKIKWKIED